MLQRNAEAVEEQGLVDEARNRRAGSRVLGEQDAAIASSGFRDVGFEGIRENTADELDLDAIIIRRQGQFQAADYLAQSNLSLMSADTAVKAGEAGARNAILEGSLRAQTAQSAAISGTIGMAIQAAGIRFSDARLKTDIRCVGSFKGVPVYSFRFVWDEAGTVRHGVMAQEVQERYPAAVIRDASGALCVDYAKIG